MRRALWSGPCDRARRCSLASPLRRLPMSAALCDCDVEGNDDLDAIEGRVLIPARGFEGDPGIRHEAATCEGCAWAITPSCDGNDEETRTAAPASSRCARRRACATTSCAAAPARSASPTSAPPASIPRPRSRSTRSRRGCATTSSTCCPTRTRASSPSAGALVNVPALFAAGQPALDRPRHLRPGRVRGRGHRQRPLDVGLRRRVAGHVRPARAGRTPTTTCPTPTPAARTARWS